jgi:DNA-binding MarR family transcriptional regulator
MPSNRTLGTLLRHLIEHLDDAVEHRYRAAGFGYKPRYTPVVRALLDLHEASLRQIAHHAQITHSAVSQTIAQMGDSGLVETVQGTDARQHVVRLTSKANRMVPELRSIWLATNTAADRLDTELPYSLSSLLADTISTLEKRSFEERIRSEQEQLQNPEEIHVKHSKHPSRKPLSAKPAIRSILLTLTAYAAIHAACLGQNTSPTPVLDAATRRAVVQQMEADINSTYVFREMRPALVSMLEQAFKEGRYDVSDPNIFAEKVTEDLEAVSHDGHLYLNSDPEQYAATIAPPRSDAGLDAYRRRLAIRTHSGLTKLEILPGNLRYLQVEAFHWTPVLTPAAYDDALKFLSDGDALILDLRENGGGNSDAVDYLARLLRPLAKRKPLYILVDAHVASAAEAISYGFQQEKLATIVGGTTYGAANNNKKLPIAPQFILSVSYNRPVNPISGTNWEGVGVVPDLKVPSTQALAAAELDAYRRLRSTPGLAAERAAEYTWAAVATDAQLHPVVIAAAHLQTLVGDYGTISVRYADGALRLNRSDRPKWQKNLLLAPLSADDTFQVEGSEDLRLRFTRSGLDLLHGSEDEREPFTRSTVQR